MPYVILKERLQALIGINLSNEQRVYTVLRSSSPEEIRCTVEETVEDFINVNFTLHPKAISETANRKIRDGL